ncbi:MAG: histidine phosphatase family protein [Candidatus Woesearchaeota archaeon]
MKLIIVRHGETFENSKGISQGHLNSQLSQKGIEQARRIAERLKDININVAYSSDLDRALNTCKEILKFQRNTSLIETKILREQSKGIFEGRTKEERDQLFKGNSVPFHEWLPEGGERLVDVWEKVIPFFEEVKAKHQVETVLFVSHGGPISCILAYLHNKEISDFRDYLPEVNTAVSVVEIYGDKTVFKRLNCSQHLD